MIVTMTKTSETWSSVLSCAPGNTPTLHPGPWFNIKISSYQYRKSHCGDKTVVRSSYLHNGISYTGKMTSLYWISPLVSQHLLVGSHLSPLPTGPSQRQGRRRSLLVNGPGLDQRSPTHLQEYWHNIRISDYSRRWLRYQPSLGAS